MLRQEKVGEIEGMTTLLKLFSCHFCCCSLILHFIVDYRRDESWLNLDTSLNVWLNDVFIGVAEILGEHFLNAGFCVLSFAFGPVATSSTLLLISKWAAITGSIDFILAFLSLAKSLNFFMTLISGNRSVVARAIALIIQVIMFMCTLALHGKFFLRNESCPSDALWLSTLSTAHIRLLGLRKVTPVEMRSTAWDSI